MTSSVWGLLLAGGDGTRLWPRSDAGHPKPCLEVNGRTLLSAALDRLQQVVPQDRTLIVTSARHAGAIRSALPPAMGEQVLAEPTALGTFAAILAGTARAERRGAELVVVLPADHVVAQPALMRSSLHEAIREARDSQAIVLLGMEPPVLGGEALGWIVPVATGGKPGRIARFVEKPPASGLARLCALGGRCNAGVFVFRPASLAAALEGDTAGANALAALRAGAGLHEVWHPQLAGSFDRRVLERSVPRTMVACATPWGDVGTWPRLAEQFPAGPLGRQRVAHGVAIGGGDHIVDAPKRTVVIAGLSDLLVVDTPRLLYIGRRQDADKVPEHAEILAAALQNQSGQT